VVGLEKSSKDLGFKNLDGLVSPLDFGFDMWTLKEGFITFF